MIDKIKNSLQQVGEIINHQTSNFSESAKEKGYKLIEDWINALPTFEKLGLSVNSFGLGASISPSLEVELIGTHTDFSEERLNEILESADIAGPVNLVLTTIRTTYRLHKKSGCSIKEPLIVKILVKISPEIKVYLGIPEVV